MIITYFSYEDFRKELVETMNISVVALLSGLN
jgi:hypothetical protein